MKDIHANLGTQSHQGKFLSHKNLVLQHLDKIKSQSLYPMIHAYKYPRSYLIILFQNKFRLQ